VDTTVRGPVQWALLLLGLLLLTACARKATLPAEAVAPRNAYFPSQAAAWEGKPLSAADFSAPETCASCHPTVNERWQASAHARAGTDPLYLGWLQAVTVDTEGKLGPFCAGCHAPIGLLAGQVKTSRQWRGLVIASPNKLAASGVSCDFCHTVEALNANGDAAYVVHPQRASLPQALDRLTPVQQTVFLKATGHAEAYNRGFYATSEFCAVCHEATNPATGLPVMTTYSEWRESPYNTGDPATTTTCQDCHMSRQQKTVAQSPIPRRVAELPGLVEQPNLADHSLLANAPAVDMKIATNCGGAANTCEVDVTIHNVGAGHDLPTGDTELRHLWLEVRGFDASGAEIWHAGQVNEYGDPIGDTIIYGTVFEDANGIPTQRFWEAARVRADHRIPPQGSVTETFHLTLPEGVKEPLRFTAVLKQRAVPQYFASLMAIMRNLERLDVTTRVMARAEFTTPSVIGSVQDEP